MCSMQALSFTVFRWKFCRHFQSLCQRDTSLESHPCLSYHPNSIGVIGGEDEESFYAVFTSLFLRPKDSFQRPFLTDPNQIQVYLNMYGCILCMTLAPILDLHGVWYIGIGRE